MIGEIVNRDLVTVSRDTPIREVATLMESKDVGSVLVVENDIPRGIITDRDIVLRCISDSQVNIDDCKASDVMTDSIDVVPENAGLFDCISKMRDGKVRRMPVVDSQGKAIGILSFGDIMAVLTKELSFLALAATPVADKPEALQSKSAA